MPKQDMMAPAVFALGPGQRILFEFSYLFWLKTAQVGRSRYKDKSPLGHPPETDNGKRTFYLIPFWEIKSFRGKGSNEFSNCQACKLTKCPQVNFKWFTHPKPPKTDLEKGG
jgi:hypothetical protein